jgi:hypothetical protein
MNRNSIELLAVLPTKLTHGAIKGNYQDSRLYVGRLLVESGLSEIPIYPDSSRCPVRTSMFQIIPMHLH